MTAISLSTDPESRDNYGPYVPNIGAASPSSGKVIRYNNIADLEEVLEAHGKETAAFIVEPIQGEAGVVVPDDDYLGRVSALCKKHNVLFICDEIQTGIGRTGKMLCHQWAGIKPDLVTLGKAISGGMYPVSVSNPETYLFYCWIFQGAHHLPLRCRWPSGFSRPLVFVPRSPS